MYKIASKSLLNKLKIFLPTIVLENKSAFVLGSMITDKSLIPLKIFHSIKERSDSRKGLVAMKLVTSKAYDRVARVGFSHKALVNYAL